MVDEIQSLQQEISKIEESQEDFQKLESKITYEEEEAFYEINHSIYHLSDEMGDYADDPKLFSLLEEQQNILIKSQRGREDFLENLPQVMGQASGELESRKEAYQEEIRVLHSREKSKQENQVEEI